MKTVSKSKKSARGHRVAKCLFELSDFSASTGSFMLLRWERSLDEKTFDRLEARFKRSRKTTRQGLLPLFRCFYRRYPESLVENSKYNTMIHDFVEQFDAENASEAARLAVDAMLENVKANCAKD